MCMELQGEKTETGGLNMINRLTARIRELNAPVVVGLDPIV